jgi:hypothetical protein
MINKLEPFYLICALVGTVIPWWFFASFFASEGLNVPAFIGGLFSNGAAGGFAADVLISIAVFWVWSFYDARELKIGRWWLVLPSAALVGLSLALPLYLYLRAQAKLTSNEP